jgi:hypothetical protein
MIIKKYNDFMNENKRTTYDYGCVMLEFKSPELLELHNMIDKNDLHQYGMETRQHVTLLYGIHSDEVSDQDVTDICIKYDYPRIRIHNLSLFKNNEFDVLKLDVDCSVLHEVNRELSKLPHTTEYPVYKPHVTIAYLKPGLGDKYLGIDFTECYAKPIGIEYSHPDGSSVKRKIKF